jgi:hypothetical protein
MYGGFVCCTIVTGTRKEVAIDTPPEIQIKGKGDTP